MTEDAEKNANLEQDASKPTSETLEATEGQENLTQSQKNQTENNKLDPLKEEEQTEEHDSEDDADTTSPDNHSPAKETETMPSNRPGENKTTDVTAQPCTVETPLAGNSGQEILARLKDIGTLVEEGKNKACENCQTITDSLKIFASDIAKQLSALKVNSDMLMSAQKKIDQEYRYTAEASLLDMIVNIYREIYKALDRAREQPDKALEEVEFCLQLVEDSLFNIGILKYEPEAGIDSYEPREGKQKLIATDSTGDKNLDQKISKLVFPGFLRDGRGLSDVGKAWVRVYRYDANLDTQETAESPEKVES